MRHQMLYSGDAKELDSWRSGCGEGKNELIEMLQMWKANTQIKYGLRKLRAQVLPGMQRHQSLN